MSKKPRFKIINGPNINLLGTREIEIYGKQGFQEYFRENIALKHEAEITHSQYNSEGDIIDEIHKSLQFPVDGIIINPGGYSHTSIAIMDAIKSINIPTIEVHISNVHARDEFRQKLITGRVSYAVISGCGLYGYNLAIESLINKINNEES